MSDAILTEVDAATHVATLTLNKPDKFNAFDARARRRLGRRASTAWRPTSRCTRSSSPVPARRSAPAAISRRWPRSRARSRKKEFLRDHVHRVQRSLRDVAAAGDRDDQRRGDGGGLRHGAALRPADRRRRGEDRRGLRESRARPGRRRRVAARRDWSVRRARSSCSGPARCSTAQQAAEWGLVNQSVPRDELSRRHLRAGREARRRPAARAAPDQARRLHAPSRCRATRTTTWSPSYMAVAQSSEDFKRRVEAAQAGEKPIFRTRQDPRP